MFLYFKNEFLIGRVTHMGDHWSLPKGRYDEVDGDTKTTAIRELFEETGIVADKNKVEYHGEFPYTYGLSLVVYKYKLDKKIPAETIVCESYFKEYDQLFPEIDEFKYITKDVAHKYLNQHTCRAIENI